MGIADQFKNYAMDYAERANARLQELDRKLAQLETERVKVETQRKSASEAFQRLRTYPIKVGNDFVCPACWIDRGAMSPMRTIPSETNNDLFRCNLCHVDLEFEP